MRKLFFVVNPNSGKGITRKKVDRVINRFREAGLECESLFTKSSLDATMQTRKALKQGYTEIISCGGDGSANAVVNGFFEQGNAINSSASLGIAQLGSGSDYFRSISMGKNWENIILQGKKVKADVGIIEYADAKAHYFLNMAGIGISYEVTRRKEHLPLWMPSKLKYVIPTLAAFRSFIPQRISLEINGKAYEDNYLGVFISKGQYAGAGMRFGKGAGLFDGFFEITLVRPISAFKLLRHLGSLYKGDLDHIPEVTKIRSSRIDFDPIKQGHELDGDPFLGTINNLHIGAQINVLAGAQ